MTEDLAPDYLAGLSRARRAELTRVNDPGLTALREYLSSGEAVAFLGAGVSAPLYPLWGALIRELVDAAADRLGEKQTTTCRALASESPEAVVEIVRRTLGAAGYRDVLRRVLRVRIDLDSGRSWTEAQELVCRCAFKAVVTTNYDPGIVDARMRVRPGASATGFTTWDDELGLDRWRTGDVLGEAELPVLFAHGQHNRPDNVVLAATEYRRAYEGKLPQVLTRLVDGHLVWIGFSFADQRIAAILREVADTTGTRVDPGAAPRHIAVMAWDPAGEDNDPGILAQRAEIEYGSQVVLYPAPGGDHSRLAQLLSGFVDDRFPPAADLATRATRSAVAPGHEDVTDNRVVPVKWVPGVEQTEHFTGRAEELSRLDQWATDPEVSLVGVTAWGGAGKTALVTHWVQQGRWSRRSGVAGVFGWSFYADPVAEHWATRLLRWARQDLGIQTRAAGRPTTAVLGLLRAVPLLLVMDGLEVVQEGPAGDEFGRLLDGTLREVLAAACQLQHAGLILLTSRFPFADLETFDGGRARMLEVPPFSPAEGSKLLATAGGDWLDDGQRRALVQAVDGHALAVGVLAGLLADQLPASDLARLHRELAEATQTSARVSRVLEFYADRMSDADRYLLAAASLFARPVPPETILAVGQHEAPAGKLSGWTATMVQAAVQDRLGGLASSHPDGTISTHPLVRNTFRPLALGAAEIAAGISLTEVPDGQVTSRVAALRVVEAIELLLDAGQWQPADDIYQRRVGFPPVWLTLPAARLGQRASNAFVATPVRRDICVTRLDRRRLRYYLNEVGFFAMLAGDLVTARDYLPRAIRNYRDDGTTLSRSISLLNLSECLTLLGETASAGDAATEAIGYAESIGEQMQIAYSRAYLGWIAALEGDTIQAERQFSAADQAMLSRPSSKNHLYSLPGTLWAEWLALTGRNGPAWALTQANVKICLRYHWNADLARCHRLLGRLALAAGHTRTAGEFFTQAVECFRDGDYLAELASTLTDLAEHARVVGNLDAADSHVTQAIAIAAPRNLAPAHSTALAVRARIQAVQAQATDARSGHLARGRDAADAALRLASRHHLAWHKLDALHAHAVLDHVEGLDQGWAAQADALRARLVLPSLDPDPLSTPRRSSLHQ